MTDTAEATETSAPQQDPPEHKPTWWQRHYTFTGTVLALVFLWLSLTPSLLPRGPLFQGLVSGATVRLAGTQVGQVERVELATRADGRPGVRVLLQIDEDVRQRIRSDSVARIATLGLLGDQLVEISIGTSGAPVLEDGAELATLDPFDLNAMV